MPCPCLAASAAPRASRKPRRELVLPVDASEVLSSLPQSPITHQKKVKREFERI